MININQQVKLLKEDYLTNSKLKEQSFKQIMNEMNLHNNQNKQVYTLNVYIIFNTKHLDWIWIEAVLQ